MEITQTQKTLLGIVSHALTGAEYAPPADTDWAALFAQSKAQAVAPMVFSCISHQCTDSEVFKQWKEITVRSLQKNRKIQYQHGVIHQLLTENQIPYTIIKGSASARDYPDPLMRAMGDVDFLVPDTHWEQAKEVFLKEGFVSSGEEHPFHLSFHKKGFGVEMHHEPFGLTGEGAEALLDIVPELVEKSVPVELDGISFRMPDAFGHGIVLLLHAYRHLMDVGIGVRHLCDWAMFIRNFSEEEFVRIFKERFEKLGIWKLTQVFSATAHCYLSIPYQNWMGDIDKQTCKMLMMDILDGGNFGGGGGERVTQNMLLNENEKKVTGGNNLVQMLRGLNSTAAERYPRLMNIKILRPFGWLIIGVRYVFRVLTGRRHKAPSDTVQMVSIRRKLYRQISIFETK